MAARELEVTAKAVETYEGMRILNLECPLKTERELKEMVAESYKISVSTLNRALKRDRG